MSKVLVDRELLDSAATWLEVHAPGGGCVEGSVAEDLRAILAQPAEMEGVELPIVATLLLGEVFHGSNGPEIGDWDIEHNPGVTEKIAQQCPGEAFDLVLQRDHLATLSAVTAERDGLAAARMAYANEFAPDENGDPDVGNVHANIRALKAERDRLKEEMGILWKKLDKFDSQSHGITALAENERLRTEVEALRKDAERWNYVRIQGDDMHWLNLLRVDLDDFGGNINAAVDALIDGEAPAMAAKEA